MQKKIEELEQEYQEIKFSLNTYGDKGLLPDTFEEYAKSKGIVNPALKKLH